MGGAGGLNEMEPALTNRGDGAARVATIDRNSVELEDPTDLFTTPMADTKMAIFLAFQ